MKKIFFVSFFIFCLVVAVSMVSAATINVPDDYSTIQAAINAASSGDTIQVAAGTYTENINVGTSNLTIQGAGADSTTINGGSSGSVITVSGALSGITIAAFTITAGFASDGGGVFIEQGATVSVSNCIVASNTASITGGGIAVVNSTATISGCLIRANTAGGGGGVWVYGSTATITDTIITGNTADTSGGGLGVGSASTVTVTNCTIISNTSTSVNGGGIYIIESSTFTITESTIESNTANNTNPSTGGGGGLYANASSVTLERCIVTSNSANDTAGCLFSFHTGNFTVTVTNCSFVANTANSENYASALTFSLEDGGTATVTAAVTNCTFATNTDINGGNILVVSLTPTFRNCIIAGAPGYGLIDVAATPLSTMINNNFNQNTGGAYLYGFPGSGTVLTIDQINALSGCSGNIGVDNDFVGGQNYHLEAASGAVNAGSATEAPDTDIDGVPRPQGSGYDIGCYEFPYTWYLAEGTTTGTFDEFVLIQNPNTDTANVTVTFMRPADSEGNVPDAVTQTLTVGPSSRHTIHVNNVENLSSTDVSTQVQSTNDVGIFVERAMYWTAGDVPWYGGHNSIAVPAPATTWFLAEGTTNGTFDTYVLIQNPNSTTANITVTFMLPADSDGNAQAPVTQTLTVPPASRQTIHVNSVEGLSSTDVSTRVKSTNSVGVICERAMYWDAGDVAWAGGHNTIGTTKTATTWYLAEGATTGSFDEYVLIQNPNDVSAAVTVTFMLPADSDGNAQDPVTQTLTVGALSRQTIHVNGVDGLSSTAVSTKIESTNEVGIIAERSMYWDAGGVDWAGGHASIGVRELAAVWFLAEGTTTGSFDEYVLIQNPNSGTTANITVTFMRPADSEGNIPDAITQTLTLDGQSRTTIHVNSVEGLSDTDVSTTVRCTNSQGIIAERAMYWDAGDTDWAGGHNSPGNW